MRKFEVYGDIMLVVGLFLAVLPLIAERTRLQFLSFLLEIPAIIFPSYVRIFSIAIFIFLFISLFGVSYYLRVKRGGLGKEDETVILIKDNIYGLVRHPQALLVAIALPLVLIFVADELNVLMVVGSILFFFGMYLLALDEEVDNVKKWGDEYRRYQREVPCFNVILGLWRWIKRRKR